METHPRRSAVEAADALGGPSPSPSPKDRMPIGEFSRRSGLAASALRFYEAEGLLSSTRSTGGHRQYRRADLRRVAFIRAAQQLGMSLQAVREALATLPEQRTPTAADWRRISQAWGAALQTRIQEMQRMHDTLLGCIGCGCLSLKQCALYNPLDGASSEGAGARRWVLQKNAPSKGK